MPPPREPPRARILVAEDDPAILELLTVRLELAGRHVIGVRDGAQALQRMASMTPALAVLDVNMPKTDGFGVLRAMRADIVLRRVPVLMLTALNAPGDVMRARELGADDYLTKPFDDQQLLARVSRLLAKGRKPSEPPGSRPAPSPPSGPLLPDDSLVL